MPTNKPRRFTVSNGMGISDILNNQNSASSLTQTNTNPDNSIGVYMYVCLFVCMYVFVVCMCLLYVCVCCMYVCM